MYQVTDSDGILYPITMRGLPLRELNPGWSPVGLQTSLMPFHLLELRADGHPDAVWYLSEELDFVANTPRHFTSEQTSSVVANLSPLLREIYDQTLCAPAPAVAESTHTFDGINPLFVRELIGVVVQEGLSPPDVVAAQRLDSVSAHYTANGVRLSASLLRHCLDVTAPAAPDQAAGSLSIASPFDATLLSAQEHFAPADEALAQAWRFRDPVGQVTLYLLFRQDGTPALYIPAMNTVFAMQDGLSGADVMTAMLSHYASHTDRLVPAAPADATPEPPQADTAPHAPPPSSEPLAAEADAEPVRAADAHDGPAEQRPDSEPPAGMPPTNWWKRLFGLGNP